MTQEHLVDGIASKVARIRVRNRVKVKLAHKDTLSTTGLKPKAERSRFMAPYCQV